MTTEPTTDPAPRAPLTVVAPTTRTEPAAPVEAVEAVVSTGATLRILPTTTTPSGSRARSTPASRLHYVLRVWDGTPVEEVAAAAGVTPATVRRWVRAHPRTSLLLHSTPTTEATTEATVTARPVDRTSDQLDPAHPLPPATTQASPDHPTGGATPQPHSTDELKQSSHLTAPAPRLDRLSKDSPGTVPERIAQPTAHAPDRRTWKGRHLSLSLSLSILLLVAVISWFIPLSDHVRPGVVALHVISLTVGLGAVLSVDWYGLAWLIGRQRLPEVAGVAGGLESLIWLGLTGLIVTGSLLKPDLTSAITDLKLALVAAVLVNGLALRGVRERLTTRSPGTTFRFLPTADQWRLITGTTVSQIGWWGATIIGFINAAG